MKNGAFLLVFFFLVIKQSPSENSYLISNPEFCSWLQLLPSVTVYTLSHMFMTSSFVGVVQTVHSDLASAFAQGCQDSPGQDPAEEVQVSPVSIATCKDS